MRPDKLQSSFVNLFTAAGTGSLVLQVNAGGTPAFLGNQNFSDSQAFRIIWVQAQFGYRLVTARYNGVLDLQICPSFDNIVESINPNPNCIWDIIPVPGHAANYTIRQNDTFNNLVTVTGPILPNTPVTLADRWPSASNQTWRFVPLG